MVAPMDIYKYQNNLVLVLAECGAVMAGDHQLFIAKHAHLF